MAEINFPKDEINGNCRETARICLQAAKIAEEIVKESYKDCAPDMSFSFPINIEAVAKYHGISIAMDRLDQPQGQPGHMSAALICHENDACIYVNDKIGYKTRRYAIAHAIAQYLLKSKESILTSTYAIPLIPQNLNAISADMVAMFMLMPIGLFADELRTYMEDNEIGQPMDVDRWLKHLSDRTQIMPFILAIGYQYLKMALCYERGEKLKDEEYAFNSDDLYEMIYA